MELRGRRILTAVVSAALVASVAGCTAAPVATPVPTPSYTSDYVTPEPVEYAHLTGVEIPAGTADNPSLAAKIDNHPDARPQVGLQYTDLVYEEMVEGGLTRYVAVWQSTIPREIGPVRSIRPMDPDIISPLGGIVAYSGGQYRFVLLMQQTKVFNAVHGSAAMDDIMFRTPDKAAPHNVLVKAKKLVSEHGKLSAPKQQFSFAADQSGATAVREGKPVGGVKLRFGWPNQVGWGWDAETSHWLRSQDGKSDKDAKGKRLTATNVVIIRVPVSYGFGLPKTELIGTGKATVLSGGKAVSATWSKSSRTAAIRLVDSSGAVIRLAPGNSWIELVPSSGGADLTPAK